MSAAAVVADIEQRRLDDDGHDEDGDSAACVSNGARARELGLHSRSDGP